MNKKTQRSNSNSAITSLLAQGVQDFEYVPMFTNEVANIMRGFGDADLKHQNRDSVQLVEKIVHQQLRGILQEVLDVSMNVRGKPQPRPKDFEFIMRKNPVKIQRMKKYLRDLQFFKKRMKDMLGERYQSLDEDGSLDLSDEESEIEVPDKFDEEKTRRLFRADRISQILAAGTQYQEYNEARRTSFLCRNSNTMKQKMKDWLRVPQDVVLSTHILTILAFLAHETIGTLVDYCLLSRLNSLNRQVEPYDRVTSSGTSHNMLHLCPEVTQGRGQDGVKPITIQEVNEAMRRHSQQTTRKYGMHRNVTINHRSPYLAL